MLRTKSIYLNPIILIPPIDNGPIFVAIFLLMAIGINSNKYSMAI